MGSEMDGIAIYQSRKYDGRKKSGGGEDDEFILTNDES